MSVLDMMKKKPGMKMPAIAAVQPMNTAGAMGVMKEQVAPTIKMPKSPLLRRMMGSK